MLQGTDADLLSLDVVVANRGPGSQARDLLGHARFLRGSTEDPCAFVIFRATAVPGESSCFKWMIAEHGAGAVAILGGCCTMHEKVQTNTSLGVVLLLLPSTTLALSWRLYSPKCMTFWVTNPASERSGRCVAVGRCEISETWMQVSSWLITG